MYKNDNLKIIKIIMKINYLSIFKKSYRKKIKLIIALKKLIASYIKGI